MLSIREHKKPYKYNKFVYDTMKRSLIKTCHNKKNVVTTSYFFNLPPRIRKTINEWAFENLDINDVCGKYDYGIEYDSHITIMLYLLGDTEEIYKKIASYGTIQCTLSKLSKFECETYDVLYISVNETTNRYLQELYIDLCKIGYRQIEWYKAFQKYVPHITIAYLKKGTIDKYIKNYKFDFSNISFPLDIITIKRNSEPKKKAG